MRDIPARTVLSRSRRPGALKPHQPIYDHGQFARAAKTSLLNRRALTPAERFQGGHWLLHRP